MAETFLRGLKRPSALFHREDVAAAAATAAAETQAASKEECSDDGESESSAETSQSDLSFHSGIHAKEIVQVASEAESKRVGFFRLMFLSTFVLTGVIMSTATFVALRANEINTSSANYALYTNALNEALAKEYFKLWEGFRTIAETIASIAQSSNQSFPFVTLSTWEVLGKHALEETDAEAVFYMPLVTNISAWNQYSSSQDWWSESIRAASRAKWLQHPTLYRDEVRNPLYVQNASTTVAVEEDEEVHLPLWMSSPPPLDTRSINFDMMSLPWVKHTVPFMAILENTLIFSEVIDFSSLVLIGLTSQEHLDLHDLTGNQNLTNSSAFALPHSVILVPVNIGIDELELVGVVAAVFPWERYLTNVLMEGVSGLTSVLESSCGQTFTYGLNGNTATYLGPGDLHDTSFDGTKTTIPITSWNATKAAEGHCTYQLQVYTTSTYWTDTTSDKPVIYAVLVAVTFLLVVITAAAYDSFVQRRTSKIVSVALKSHAMVASLFPSNVRNRLFESNKTDKGNDDDRSQAASEISRYSRHSTLRGYLNSGSNDDSNEQDVAYEGKPIADLFPDTTVMFADIAGFTAWSSVREPAQVFTLLETLYRAFDEIAKRRRVFKVETIGDCYVAVTGLPEPRRDHAVAMARFARECMTKLQVLTKKLEVSLGPDTGDLDMRAGLHSGPVTAGVLRGERSRFQLFGDTMNTASRMESTGIKGRIQISEDTAELLRNNGKGRWIKPRSDKVVAKGKGEMQTYWLVVNGRQENNEDQSENSMQDSESTEQDVQKDIPAQDEKTTRLIEWNVEVLLRLLKQIVARRYILIERNPSRRQDADEVALETNSHMVIEEVREIITLPNEDFLEATKDADHITLDPLVVQQLTDYVSNIAALYNDNPFHNYEHASHVTMSVVKLLSRIVAPSENQYDEDGMSLHDHTYGITSDPLTQFACVLSALIHDVDHSGVPNAQLMAENTLLARQYQGKSIAEQNSLDLAWNLLMDESYRDLRKVIYTTQAGLIRFRQLLVNSVMATDIVDKELKALRNARWEKAFSKDYKDENERDAVNRKATIVIEHLIQASDVSHTMQHWHIYRKWNERFFIECYKAYKEGRAEKDPSEGWYQGELGFYDFYIIPLAKKLKDCGVFGVSSDEYLNYAVRNRKEWEERGREVVDEMIEKVKKMDWSSPPKQAL